MKYALIAAVESEFRDTNVEKGIATSSKRRLESEAIECFTNWRKHGGWLKDIPIYAVCPTRNVVSEETKNRFEELGVIYIEEYQPIVETFTSGFLNIPLVGKMIEERTDIDVLIKIDLDMNLIKPLPESLVSNGITIGQYDDYCTKMQRVPIGDHNPIDTGFIISPQNTKLYHKFFDQCMVTMTSDDPDWLEVKAKTGDYFIEEFVMDKIYLSKEFNINLIQRYQIGEWYTPVNQLSDEDLKSVYFWHEHLEYDPEYDKIREKIEYSKRTRRINK